METARVFLEFANRAQWRAWLEENHASATEAWLVLYKKRYADQGLTLDEATEEALCFGWIDGQLKSLDERRYTLRYAPRTANSIWSVSNIRRVEQLIAAGRMTAAGQRKIDEAKAGGPWDAAIRREQVDVIPEALESALRQMPGAVDAYRALPVTRKKQIIYWLESAKTEKTRQSRIHTIMEEIHGH